MAKAMRGYWQRTRRVTLWSLLAWCVLALGVPLAAQPFEAIAIKGLPLGYYAGAQGLLIALAIVALLFAYRQRHIDAALLYRDPRAPGNGSLSPPARKGGLPGASGALAMAGDWLSGATLVAVAGALFTLGHDGLSWLIGLFGGVVLSQTLIAPHLHRAQAGGVVDFIRVRFGRIAGTASLILVAMTITLVLAANVRALDTALSVLFPSLPYGSEAGILIAVGAFVMAARGTGRSGGVLVQAIAYPLILAALVLPVVVAASGFVPGHFTFGAILQQIGIVEFRLLEKELADPVTLKVFTRPFTTATPLSTVLLTISLGLGLAAMPSVLRRPVMARSCEGARLMPAVALVLILVAAAALPPLAAGARLGVLNLAGHGVDALPDSLLQLGTRGLVGVCGVKPVSQNAVASACAALADPATTLRLDDIVIARDHALFATPLLTGLPEAAGLLLGAAAALSAILAAVWLGSTLGNATLYRDGSGTPQPGLLGLPLSMVVAACAALLVLTRTADVMTLLAWGLAISAAGLAPALIAGVWSRHATAAGAVAGMLVGAGLTLYYVVATRYFATAFYDMWSMLSSAGYGAIADYEAAKEAITQAVPGDEIEAVRHAYVEAARAIANWWGLRDVAAGSLGAAVGLTALALVSLVTPRPGGEAVGLISRIRGLSPGV